MSQELEYFRRLHEIREEREELEEQLRELMNKMTPLKETIKKLDSESDVIEEALGELAQQQGNKISFVGIGSMSVEEQVVYEIVNKEDAIRLVQEDPRFFSAQDVSVDRVKFIDTAKQIEQETGQLIGVSKYAKLKRRLRLSK